MHLQDLAEADAAKEQVQQVQVRLRRRQLEATLSAVLRCVAP
jgi:hypothetical protein